MIHPSLLASLFWNGTRVGPTAAVERAHSYRARSGSKGSARVPFHHFHRARSASKKGTWPLPSDPSETARCTSTGVHLVCPLMHLLSLCVPRAQEINGPPSPFLLNSLTTSPKGAGSWGLNCARRTTTALSWGFREHGGSTSLPRHTHSGAYSFPVSFSANHPYKASKTTNVSAVVDVKRPPKNM